MLFFSAASCSFSPRFSRETAKNLCSAFAFCKIVKFSALSPRITNGATYDRAQVYHLCLKSFQVVHLRLCHALHAFIGLRELIDFLIQRIDSL